MEDNERSCRVHRIELDIATEIGLPIKRQSQRLKDQMTVKEGIFKVDSHTEVLSYNYTNTYTHTHTCIHKMGSDLNN